jgi:hypothetical protein
MPVQKKPSTKPQRLYKIRPDCYEYQLKQVEPYQVVPVLRLRGFWIEQAGFSVNQHVRVSIRKNRITITPLPTQPDVRKRD